MKMHSHSAENFSIPILPSPFSRFSTPSAMFRYFPPIFTFMPFIIITLLSDFSPNLLIANKLEKELNKCEGMLHKGLSLILPWFINAQEFNLYLS